jgi:hypothetical protein
MLNWKKIFCSSTEFAEFEKDKGKVPGDTGEDVSGSKGTKIVGIEKDGVLLLCKHFKDQVLVIPSNSSQFYSGWICEDFYILL